VDIYKDDLPAGLSYALKPSLLEDALQGASVVTRAALFQSRSGWAKNAVVFAARFYPPGRHYRNDDDFLTVSSAAVPSQCRPQARAFVESIVLPQFIEWIVALEQLPSNSTRRREVQSFTRLWKPDAEPECPKG
jgi:hypothetical protein